MKSPVLSSVGAKSDLRSDNLVPGPPRQARAGPSFDDYQARPALQLSPPFDPRYPWITDRKLLDVIDSEQWDQTPGLLACLEEQWICTTQELENISVADLLAIQWNRSDMCAFLLLVARIVDRSYDRDTFHLLWTYSLKLEIPLPKRFWISFLAALGSILLISQ